MDTCSFSCFLFRFSFFFFVFLFFIFFFFFFSFFIIIIFWYVENCLYIFFFNVDYETSFHLSSVFFQCTSVCIPKAFFLPFPYLVTFTTKIFIPLRFIYYSWSIFIYLCQYIYTFIVRVHILLCSINLTRKNSFNSPPKKLTIIILTNFNLTNFKKNLAILLAN